jgi:hypothetical protein
LDVNENKNTYTINYNEETNKIELINTTNKEITNQNQITAERQRKGNFMFLKLSPAREIETDGVNTYRHNCFSENCKCVTHSAWVEMDVKMLRRQVEDRLRKGSVVDILKVANLLDLDFSRADKEVEENHSPWNDALPSYSDCSRYRSCQQCPWENTKDCQLAD